MNNLINPLERDIQVDAAPYEVVVAKESIILCFLVKDIKTMDCTDVGGDRDIWMNGVVVRRPSRQSLEAGSGMRYSFGIRKGSFDFLKFSRFLRIYFSILVNDIV